MQVAVGRARRRAACCRRADRGTRGRAEDRGRRGGRPASRPRPVGRDPSRRRRSGRSCVSPSRGSPRRLAGLMVRPGDHRSMLAGYPPAMTTPLADARAAVPGPRREVRVRPQRAPGASGDGSRGTVGGGARARAAAGDRRRLERRPGDARTARCHRGPPADPVALVERRRPLVGRLLASAGRSSSNYVAPDRYDSLYALWPGDPGVPQCGWGCTLGSGGGDVRCRVQLDLDRPLADARHRPRPAAGIRPRVAPPGRGRLSSARPRRGRAAGPARCRRLHLDAGDPTSRRSGSRTPDYHDGRGTGRAPARTWSPWYRDWMTGRLRRVDATTAPSAPIGLTPERWALRGIRRG